MYRKSNQAPITPENFLLPFEGKLSPENRWVIIAELIPWDEFEEEYGKIFSQTTGAPAKPFRMALGALIIKEKLGTSDRETLEQIKENPYLQYFIGLSSYSNEEPFEPSMMVHFRQRIDPRIINKINQKIVKSSKGEKTEEKNNKKKKKEQWKKCSIRES